MSITIYPSQFNMREDGSYAQLPAIKGEEGQQGPPGIGSITGGTKGQVPVKQSSDDYDVAWEDIVWTRLWENASPSSNFGAQSVAISGMENWSEFRVQLADYKSRTAPGIQLTFAGYSGGEQWCFNAVKFHFREITVTANGVTFGNAGTFNTYGNASQTQNNAFLIPWYIEGRKN